MCVQEPCVYLLSAASVVIRNNYFPFFKMHLLYYRFSICSKPTNLNLNWNNLDMSFPSTVYRVYTGFRARILKCLLEVEKSTFGEELSFQRSKSTTELKWISFFVSIFQ